MALFGSSDDDLARRVEELERRVAIKLLRDQTGLGLKEAKDAVDRL